MLNWFVSTNNSWRGWCRQTLCFSGSRSRENVAATATRAAVCHHSRRRRSQFAREGRLSPQSSPRPQAARGPLPAHSRLWKPGHSVLWPALFTFLALNMPAAFSKDTERNENPQPLMAKVQALQYAFSKQPGTVAYRAKNFRFEYDVEVAQTGKIAF